VKRAVARREGIAKVSSPRPEIPGRFNSSLSPELRACGVLATTMLGGRLFIVRVTEASAQSVRSSTARPREFYRCISRVNVASTPSTVHRNANGASTAPRGSLRVAVTLGREGGRVYTRLQTASRRARTVSAFARFAKPPRRTHPVTLRFDTSLLSPSSCSLFFCLHRGRVPAIYPPAAIAFRAREEKPSAKPPETTTDARHPYASWTNAASTVRLPVSNSCSSKHRRPAARYLLSP